MAISGQTNESSVEFIGGPFDGYWQSYPLSLKPLPADIFWLVSNGVFRQIDSHQHAEPNACGTLTSVALYALDNTGNLPCYKHSGSISTKLFCDVIRKMDSVDQ